jgi:hypothetical protein
MTKFVFCDYSGWVRQFDTATPSPLPFAVHKNKSNVRGLALRADKEFELIAGPNPYHIHRTQGAISDVPIYEHPLPIWCVRVRNVGGEDRIYFSALKSANQPGPRYVNIYYLKLTPLGYIPVLYTTIDPTQLVIPNPCNPSVEDWYWYSGDFVFGDNDTLYLSSGKLGDCSVGIYRVDGAGPDSVTGAVTRIHLGEGPIQSLCYRSPQTLYFERNNCVWKLDLANLGESFEGAVPLSDPNGIVMDIAEVGSGLPQPPWWVFINGLYNVLTSAALWVWSTADAMHLGRGGAEAPRRRPERRPER